MCVIFLWQKFSLYCVATFLIYLQRNIKIIYSFLSSVRCKCYKIRVRVEIMLKLKIVTIVTWKRISILYLMKFMTVNPFLPLKVTNSTLVQHWRQKRVQRLLEYLWNDGSSFHACKPPSPLWGPYFFILRWNEHPEWVQQPWKPTKSDTHIIWWENFELPAPCRYQNVQIKGKSFQEMYSATLETHETIRQLWKTVTNQEMVFSGR